MALVNVIEGGMLCRWRFILSHLIIRNYFHLESRMWVMFNLKGLITQPHHLTCKHLNHDGMDAKGPLVSCDHTCWETPEIPGRTIDIRRQRVC